MNIAKQYIFGLSKKSSFAKKMIYRFRLSRKWKYRLTDKEVANGEASAWEKEQLVRRMVEKHPREMKELRQLCREQYKKFSTGSKTRCKTEVKQIITDMMFCYMAYGMSPDEYMLFDCQHLLYKQRKSYITDLNRFEYYYWVNDPLDEKILFDKYKTAKLYHEFYKRDILKVTENTADREICDFINKNGSYVRKPLNDSRGNGVCLCAVSEGSQEQSLTEIRKHQPCLLEEVIRQDERMAALHYSSVNTIRCTTIYSENGPIVFAPVLRMGRGDSFVDNASAGGIIANIDVATGVVITDGVDEMRNIYKDHPDTGVTICGFQIPQWDLLLEFAKKLSSVMPSIGYVGWDLALTDNGWVMIEGNCHGQFLCEYVDRSGRRDELENLLCLK